ncbi:hypothetical protein HDV01_001006 [Terramyces sp. JEL0728]|nr:hypothetical protein HDV01_001006 [Terramyces sp. JEL0728]
MGVEVCTSTVLAGNIIAEFTLVSKQKESYRCPKLHLNYMKLLKNEQLVEYITDNVPIFCDYKEWLKSAYTLIKSNSQAQILFVVDAIKEFELDISLLDILGNLHELLQVRQEMTAKLELFKAQHRIQAGINTAAEIKIAIESLSLSIDCTNQLTTDKPLNYDYRIVDCTHILYYLLSAVDSEMIFKNELVYNEKLKYDIKAGIATCKWDPKVSNDISELIQKYNYFNVVQEYLLSTPWSLKDIVAVAFFNFVNGNFKKWLRKLFPNIPLRYQPNSPRKNQVDMKKTVSIADLESFFILLLLEKQATTIKEFGPENLSQLLLGSLKTTWEPTTRATEFWRYVVATYTSYIPSCEMYKSLFNVKTFPPLLNEIRGNDRCAMYGYLGMFYHDLHIYYSQEYSSSALTYLELYDSKSTKSQLFSPIMKDLTQIFTIPSIDEAKGRLTKEVVDPAKFSPQTSHCVVEAESFSFGQSTISNISLGEKPSPKPSPYPTIDYTEDDEDLTDPSTPNKSLLPNLFVMQTPSAIKWNDIGINLDSVDRRQRLLNNLEKLKA